MKERRKYWLIGILVLLNIILLSKVLLIIDIENVTQFFDGKPIEEYTWEEFEALTGSQQIEFQNSFKNDNEFEKWMNNVIKEEDISNWVPEKDIEEYTWEEFEALTSSQQIEFQNFFKDKNAFEKWMNSVIEQDDSMTLFSEKDIEEYTWEEFEALTGSQQIEFQNIMGEEKFYNWYLENSQLINDTK